MCVPCLGQFDLGDDVARQQVQLFAVEYLAAAARSGDSSRERMVHITFHNGFLYYFPKRFCASFVICHTEPRNADVIRY
jgi:hypothetical protein